MNYRVLGTVLGEMGIVFQDSKAVRILIPKEGPTVQERILSIFPNAQEDMKGMHELTRMIQSYLKGADVMIPMDLVDTSLVTPFHLRVLEAERSIPRGKAASYSWLARKAGTKAIRAAGSALARNPWPLVVPCHRAVRKDRSIGQYQGGPAMKRRLLQMEGVVFESDDRVSIDCYLD